MVEKRHQIAIGYYLLAFLAILLLRDMFLDAPRVEEITYDQFQSALEAGRIEEIRVSGDMLRGRYKGTTTGSTQEFETPRVDIELVERLEQYDVTFEGTVEDTFIRDLLSWILPAVVFIGLWVFILRRFAERQGMGGMMSIGQSKAKVYMEKDTRVTFADVAGVDEAKAELEEIVEFLKDRERYGRLGARAPKGVLLVGPPGTGKTLLARAVAGEAGVPFFSINGSEFVEMFVGVGAARVRDLFLQARQRAPAIIFIDELDALGKVRGVNPAGGHDEKEQTLNQLLAELDGFDPSAGLILLAATNRPEILDPALLRAGRFDRQVLVDRPDKLGRVQILDVHLRKIHLEKDLDRQQIAELTPGFSGADLANLVNEAALLATRRDAEAVTLEDFTEAVERIVAGLEKRNRLLNEMERRIVAYHEMGHALIAMSLSGVEQVHKVSIIPRGIGSLGYTIQRPIEERYLMTRDELEQKLMVLLGGRAAEILIFDQLSTGAADDLAKATNIARSMVTRYGMDDRLGHATYEFEQSSLLGIPMYGVAPTLSEESSKQIDESVRKIINEAFERALAWLSANRATLEAGAQKLLREESLGESDLAEFKVKPAIAAAQAHAL